MELNEWMLRMMASSVIPRVTVYPLGLSTLTPSIRMLEEFSAIDASGGWVV